MGRSRWGERMVALLRNMTRLVAVVAVMLMAVAHVSNGKAGVPPILPKEYQGSGNVLQALLDQSWPAAQGVSSTFTFFAPQNSAIKKYICLFSDSAAVSKSVATSVLQYHIVTERTFSYQQINNLAQNADYMVTTAFNGETINFTIGGNKLNGYSSINNPDIGSKENQAIHGIKTVLLPLGLTIGCGPLSPLARPANHSTASRPLSHELAGRRLVDIGIPVLSRALISLFR